MRVLEVDGVCVEVGDKVCERVREIEAVPDADGVGVTDAVAI